MQNPIATLIRPTRSLLFCVGLFALVISLGELASLVHAGTCEDEDVSRVELLR